MNTRAFEMLKEFEGFRSEAYLCPAGKPTIGYGACYYLDGSLVQLGDKITKEDASIMLEKTVNDFEVDVKRLVPYTLPQEAVDAVTLICYNIGLGAFTKSTLRKCIVNNPMDFDAIEYQWNRWNKGGGKVLLGLVKRRKKEFNLYKDGMLFPYTKAECFELGRNYPKK